MGLLLAGTAITAQQVQIERIEKNPDVQTNVASPFLLKTNYLSEDFEGGTFPPAGWIVNSGSASTITSPMQEWHLGNNGNPGGCARVRYVNSVDVHDEYLITPTVDLSSPTSSDVFLQFDFNTSIYWHVDPNDNADIKVYASTDNGATWSDTLWGEDDTTLLIASHCDGWEQYTWTRAFVNINNLTGAGMNQVKFAFHYKGQDGAQFNLDNILIADALKYDLVSIDDFGSDVSTDFEYSMIPLSQVRPMSFGLVTRNIGVDSMTGQGVDYDISDGSSSVDAGSFGDTTLLSFGIDTLFYTTSFTPSTLGTYTYTLTSKGDSTDQDPTNNERSRNLEVTNNIWALDYGTDESEINQAGAVGVDSNGVFKIGNQFFSIATDTIWSVEVGIGSNPASVGNDFFVEIRKFNTNISDWEVVATTPSHTVTNNDLGTLVNVDLNQSASLRGLPIGPGEQYVVLAGHNGGSFTERVFFTRAGLVAEGTVLWTDDNDALVRFGGKQKAMRIRPNFDRNSNTASVNENSSVLVAQNMPNPARENTVISYTLLNNTDITLTITDAMGKVVKTITRNNQPKGTHVFNVNTSDLANGIYQYTVRGAGSSVTKSMVVAK